MILPRSRISCILAVVFPIALPQLLQPQAFSSAEQGVWAKEVEYWDFRTTGKIEEYMALWHEDFIGWPATNPRPAGKADIRKRIETEIANTQPESFTVKLEPLSVRIYGDVASVFYRARYVRRDKTGVRTEAYLRITHTWQRTASGWKIITGMSADETNR